MTEYLVIGPSSAGKTALLSMVFRASMNQEGNGANGQIRVYPRSAAMQRLVEAAQQTLRLGKLPDVSSNEVEEFTFDLVVRRPRPFGFAAENVVTFRMLDGPGGSLFPEDQNSKDFDEAGYDQFRAQLVGALKEASGFILCLDAADPRPTLVMFEHLPLVMAETGLRCLPSKRLAVCLTKVDKHFVKAGRDARDRAERTSARQRANELLTSAGLGTLRNYLPPDAKVGFGWSSVYGFLPGGDPNYEPSTDGLRFVASSPRNPNQVDPARVAAVIESWKPFRVLAPFVFLATGHPADLEMVKAGGLA